MNSFARATLASAVVLSLVSCAPPGLDLEPPREEPRVSVDRTRVDFAYDEGAQPCAVLGMRVSPWYDDRGLSYQVASYDEAGLVGASADTNSEETAAVSLCPRWRLEPGTYSGVVRLDVSWDDGTPVRGSPIRVSYTVTVRPVIRVDPSYVMLHGAAGLPTRFSVDVELPDGVTDYDVTMGGEPRTFLRVVEKTPSGLTLEADGLPRGTYSGWARVSYGSMSALISVRHDVGPRPLDLTPRYPTISLASGETARVTVAVQLPDDASDYTLTPFETNGSVTVVEKAPDHFTIEVAPAPSGAYRAETWVSAGAAWIQFILYYTVTSSPGEHGLGVAPDAFAFTAVEGLSAEEQTLSVTPPSWGAAPWVRIEGIAPTSPAWLTATAGAGGFAIRADATGLPAGTHSARLLVGADVFTATRSIPVTFTVQPALLRPSDRDLQVNGATSASALAGSAPVQVRAGPARHWSATADAPWLVLDVASGTTGELLRYHVDPARLGGVPNLSTSTATVTVTTDHPTMTPARFEVRLAMALPEIHAVAPAQPAGRASRVRVLGFDFPSQPDLAAHLDVPGLAGVQVTRRSDTELQLDVPPAAAGSYPVRLTNALGVPVREGVLRVFEPATLPAAMLEGPGNRAGLVWDPVHRALYTADVDAGQVLRFTFDGERWNRASWAVPYVDTIGLAPDLTAVVALVRTGSLWILDLASSQEELHEYPSGIHGSLHAQDLAVTTDGRVWLPVGRSPSLGWFDLRTRSFSVRTDFFEGLPWFSASRDGGQLLITGLWGGRLFYPPITDVVVRAATFSRAAQSDDGGRAALEGYSVLDGVGSTLGWLAPVDGWWGTRAGAFSPDGSRFYRVEYAYAESSPLPGPSVSVYRTSGDPETAGFPILGRFEFTGQPTCADVNVCVMETRVTVAPDGQTLFLDEGQGLFVVPVPAEYQQPGGG